MLENKRTKRDPITFWSEETENPKKTKTKRYLIMITKRLLTDPIILESEEIKSWI